MEPVNIIFSCNNKFAMLLGVALCSIFENKKGDYPIEIYVIDSGLSERSKKQLQVLEKRYDFTIHYVYFDQPFTEEIPLADLLKGYSLPIENYHRIAVSRFLPSSCKKVLNLDADMVVTGDIAELFNIDLEGKVIGAVAECYPTCEAKREHLEKLCKSFHISDIPNEAVYFNSGLLLIDLELWRKRGTEEKLIKIIRENPDKLWYHDQDAFNVLFLNDFKELDKKYNLIVSQDNAVECKDPLVIHFSGGAKPWYFFSALRHRSEYLKYVKKTPWKHKRYKKIMDIYFAKRYHIYPVAWEAWNIYKKLKILAKKLIGR